MTQDYGKMMQDMMSAFPMDTSAMQGAFRTQAQLAERLSRVAIDAAEQSAEISSGWTRDTLAKMREATTVKEEPADYSKALSQLASNQAETTAETMARFAEVAKRVQMETVELMLSAGRDMAEDTVEQSRAVTARSQQTAQEMASRGQDAMTKMADQGRATAGKMAEQSRATAGKMAEQSRATADKMAEQGRAAAAQASASNKASASDKTSASDRTSAADKASASDKTAASGPQVTEKMAADAKRAAGVVK